MPYARITRTEAAPPNSAPQTKATMATMAIGTSPMCGNAGLPLGREKLFRLVAFTAARRNARGRKHTRQRKAAVITRHAIQTHFGHVAL